MNTPPSLHRYLYAYGNPTVWVDPDGHKSAFGDASQQIDHFNSWLTGKNQESGSHLIGGAVGIAKLLTGASKGLTDGLDFIANLAQTAAGVDDQQVRDELDGKFGKLDSAADFIINGDKIAAIKQARLAASNRVLDALEDDVTATSDIPEILGGLALGKANSRLPSAKVIKESAVRAGATTKKIVTNIVNNALTPIPRSSLYRQRGSIGWESGESELISVYRATDDTIELALHA